jgi:diacylglycerol kinase family enzyme
VARAALIVNPFASRVTPELTERVAAVLDADAILTERRGHATELAREASHEFDRIFIFSGDGGFNETLNGIERDIPVGFVPGGRTSVFPRTLGIPRDPLAAAAQLALGRTRRISLGRVNGRRFSFGAGIGFDAELVRRVDGLGRRHDGRRPGDLRFSLTALRTIGAHHWRFPPEVEIVGHGRAAFALVANTDPYTYAGAIGLHVAPRARFELGLDVVAPRAIRPRSLPRMGRYLATGVGQDRAADVLYLHDVDRVEVRCDRPLPLQADGEDLGDVADALFEAERNAVTVLY